MSSWPAAVGVIAGAVSGVVTAFVTGRMNREKVRTEFDGKLRLLETQWAHERDEREAGAATNRQERELQQLPDLRHAAALLVDALQDPQAIAYEHRLDNARKEIGRATSQVTRTELTELSHRLQKASADEDIVRATSVLEDLQRAQTRSHSTEEG